MAITDLKGRHFISALEPLKAQGKLESVKRVAQRINEIMYYAVNVGFIDANPAAKITAAFENCYQQCKTDPLQQLKSDPIVS